MTDFELAACVDGFNEANGGEVDPPPPTAEEFDEMIERSSWVTRH